MLTEPVNLPFGIAVSLGTFFIAVKYLYCLIYVLWVVVSVRRADLRASFVGVLGLILFVSWTMEVPLGRPYALTSSSELLPSLADSMVVAETGSPLQGWLVDHPNRHPAWSSLLALLSCLDSSRLLRLFPWIGAIGMLSFSASNLMALRWIGAQQEEHRSALTGGAALAVFFAVFLSSNPIGYLYSQPVYGLRIFYSTPHHALALPLILWAAGIYLGRTNLAKSLGALALGALAYLDLTYALFVTLASTAAMVLTKEPSRDRFKGIAFLIGGLGLGAPRIVQLLDESFVTTAISEANSGSLLTGTWIWPSPVFVLALISIVHMIRHKTAVNRFALLLIVMALLVAVATPPGMALFDPESAFLALRYLLSLSAGYAFFLLLNALQTRFQRKTDESSHWCKPVPLKAIALLILLPWTFPYWWQPRTMDPYYGESLFPISSRMESLCSWVRQNTPNTSVFLVWKNVGPWLPALTGRRVIVGEEMGDAKATPELRTLLNQTQHGDALSSLAAIRSLGVTHVVVLRTDLERLPDISRLLSDGSGLVPVFSVGRWAQVMMVTEN